MHDYRTWFLPRLARELPKTSINRMLSSMNLKRLWHRTYDPCPKLLDLNKPDGKELFEEFMDWAWAQRLKLDWSLHVYLLLWLKQHKKWDSYINQENIVELLKASISKWIFTDLTQNSKILITHCDLYPLAVIGIKSDDIGVNNKILLIQLKNEMMRGEVVCYSAFSHKKKLLNLNWKNFDLTARL